MSLARAWRRQLCAASSAALIVPAAMLAALVVLALGGGFSRVGVLGQIFAGPPAPNSGPLLGSTPQRAGHGVSASLPVIPATPAVASRLVASRGETSGRGRSFVVAPGKGTSTTGGAIAPGSGGARGVTQSTGSTGGAGPAPPSGTPGPGPSPSPGSGSSPQPGPSPAPGPSPQPTPVDTVVKLVTSVTEQVPGPARAAATQAVQSAGGAADNLLQPAGSPAPPSPPSRSSAQGLALP